MTRPNSPDVDYDEQVGDFLRRGDRLWIAPPRTLLPEIGEEPTDPWFYVGKMPEGYEPRVDRRHRYLSTGCLHGEHDYCRSNTGAAGTKIPAQCKFCEAPCICACHGAPVAATDAT